MQFLTTFWSTSAGVFRFHADTPRTTPTKAVVAIDLAVANVTNQPGVDHFRSRTRAATRTNKLGNGLSDYCGGF
jgi:hypothetical protein